MSLAEIGEEVEIQGLVLLWGNFRRVFPLWRWESEDGDG